MAGRSDQILTAEFQKVNKHPVFNLTELVSIDNSPNQDIIESGSICTEPSQSTYL